MCDESFGDTDLNTCPACGAKDIDMMRTAALEGVDDRWRSLVLGPNHERVWYNPRYSRWHKGFIDTGGQVHVWPYPQVPADAGNEAWYQNEEETSHANVATHRNAEMMVLDPDSMEQWDSRFTIDGRQLQPDMPDLWGPEHYAMVAAQVPGLNPHQAAQQLMYHVSPADRPIEQEGLDPEAEGRTNARVWREPGVYLWSDLGAAQRYAEQQFGGQQVGQARLMPEAHHIYEVDVDPDEVYPDPYRESRPDVPDYQHSWVSYEPIEPERIRRIARAQMSAHSRQMPGDSLSTLPSQTSPQAHARSAALPVPAQQEGPPANQRAFELSQPTRGTNHGPTVPQRPGWASNPRDQDYVRGTLAQTRLGHPRARLVPHVEAAVSQPVAQRDEDERVHLPEPGMQQWQPLGSGHEVIPSVGQPSQAVVDAPAHVGVVGAEQRVGDAWHAAQHRPSELWMRAPLLGHKRVQKTIGKLAGDPLYQMSDENGSHLPDPKWQEGLCDVYAMALLREHPELRLGGAGNDWVEHWFAHDDSHAYDSLGKHPLPYLGTQGQFANQWLDQDPEYWGLPENGRPADVEEARQIIRHGSHIWSPMGAGPGPGSHLAAEEGPLLGLRYVRDPDRWQMRAFSALPPRGDRLPDAMRMSVEYPTGWDHPYRGWQEEPFNRADVLDRRTPFWIAQHQEDPNDHRIFLGHPGSYHDVTHIPEGYNYVASGAIKPRGYGELGGRTWHEPEVHLFNTWVPAPVWRPQDEYDEPPESFTPEQQALEDRATNYVYQLQDMSKQALQGAFPELGWGRRAAESLLPIRMHGGCPSCGGPHVDEETGECTDCGYGIPYDGAETLDGFQTMPPYMQEGPWTVNAEMEGLEPHWGSAKQAMWPMGTGDLWHVSPRANRESILRNGLTGHEDRSTSPWTKQYEKHQNGQPMGNYFFQNPEDAIGYAHALKGRADSGGWGANGVYQESEPDFEDRYEYPEQPEDFHEWPMDRQDQWYDENEPIERADDPHGYDIWRADTRGLPIDRDPESALVEDGGRHWDLGQLHDLYQDKADAYQHTPSAEQLHGDAYDYGTEPMRLYSPAGVAPHRLQLHQHMPSWDMNDETQEEAWENAPQEIPEPWNYVPYTALPFPGHESAWKLAETDSNAWEGKMYHGSPNGLLGPVRTPFWAFSDPSEDSPVNHPVSVRFQKPLRFWGQIPPFWHEIAQRGGHDGIVVQGPQGAWTIALDPGTVVPGHDHEWPY